MSLRKDGLNFMLLGFVACRVLHYFFDSYHLKIASVVLVLTVIIMSVSKLPRITMAVLGTLFAGGVVLLVTSGADLQTWLDAVLQNGNVAMLLIIVPLISAPFYYEDYQSELKTLAQVRMRSLMSFLLFVSVTMHVLAVIVSVGAILIIYNLMKPFAQLYDAHEPYLRVASRSYSSSGFWSPAWASAIVYSAIPGVQWVKIIPVGIAFAVLFNGISLFAVFMEKKRYPTRYHDIQPKDGDVVNKKKLSAMLILAIAMIGSIAIVSAVTGWDLMLIVSLMSLLFPLGAALVQRHVKAYKREVKSFYDTSLVKVREQVALFTLAGFLGKALDVAGVGAFLTGILPDWLKAYPTLMVCLIMLLMILASFVGIHPGATGTAIVTAFSPASLGLTSYTFCLTILIGWLLTIMMAPFSATALMLSSATGRSNFSLSIGLNWKFCAVCLVIFSLLIAAVGPIMG